MGGRKIVDLSQVSATDWAKLAAFIDAEGHIHIGQTANKKSGRIHNYVAITVVNTDPRLSEWLMERFSGSVWLPKRTNPTRWKQAFHWKVSTQQAADILRMVLPHFVLKREQAEIALSFVATICMVGRRGVTGEVRAERDDLRRKLRVLTARGPRVEAVG